VSECEIDLKLPSVENYVNWFEEARYFNCVYIVVFITTPKLFSDHFSFFLFERKRDLRFGLMVLFLGVPV